MKKNQQKNEGLSSEVIGRFWYIIVGIGALAWLVAVLIFCFRGCRPPGYDATPESFVHDSLIMIEILLAIVLAGIIGNIYEARRQVQNVKEEAIKQVQELTKETNQYRQAVDQYLDKLIKTNQQNSLSRERLLRLQGYMRFIGAIQRLNVKLGLKSPDLLKLKEQYEQEIRKLIIMIPYEKSLFEGVAYFYAKPYKIDDEIREGLRQIAGGAAYQPEIRNMARCALEENELTT